MQSAEFSKILISLFNSGLFLGIYLFFCLVIIKIVINKNIRAFLIGLLTIFFSYKLAINIAVPISHLAYIFKIYNPDILFLLIYGFAKPLSIFLGIMITLILLIKDELIKQIK
jgi:hypothetical protein